MSALLSLVLAAGRSENPDEGAGVLLIVGIIVLVVLVIGAVLFSVARLTARRGGSPGHEG